MTDSELNLDSDENIFESESDSSEMFQGNENLSTPTTSLPRHHYLLSRPRSTVDQVVRSDPRAQSARHRETESIQSQLSDILQEIKKTNSRFDAYEDKIEGIEQRIINLEKIQSSTPSTDDSTENPKRKVPNHVRVSIFNHLC